MTRRISKSLIQRRNQEVLRSGSRRERQLHRGVGLSIRKSGDVETDIEGEVDDTLIQVPTLLVEPPIDEGNEVRAGVG